METIGLGQQKGTEFRQRYKWCIHVRRQQALHIRFVRRMDFIEDAEQLSGQMMQRRNITFSCQVWTKEEPLEVKDSPQEESVRCKARRFINAAVIYVNFTLKVKRSKRRIRVALNERDGGGGCGQRHRTEVAPEIVSEKFISQQSENVRPHLVAPPTYKGAGPKPREAREAHLACSSSAIISQVARAAGEPQISIISPRGAAVEGGGGGDGNMMFTEVNHRRREVSLWQKDGIKQSGSKGTDGNS
ncbi:hypothetical protein EYF80_010598 [Liparis tanakae]|uniref:Uncharacterized protein n=1 Tax=Liparis tanakae TaxID=230148 RepID=A0A4Z2IM76_9TELE|nr:hypothetical protein EYF80_010598 [Liparis tanakae]